MTNSALSPLKRLETDSHMSQFLEAWEELRVLHKEIPAQAVTCFLYIASHNPCHKMAIEEDQGLTTASCSRSIDFLCEKNRLNSRGLGLIRKYSDESNLRRYYVELTPKGEELAQRLKKIIYP